METNLQLYGEPIQSMAALESFLNALSEEKPWCKAVILADKEKVIICLVDERHSVAQALRISFDEENDIIYALSLLNCGKKKIECACLEDGISSVQDITAIQLVVDGASIESRTFEQAYKQFFKFKEKTKGRGPSITAATAREVVFESHGYCMFEGCGLDLGVDDLTGVKGNFRYLAHIVAASSDGPRGDDSSHTLSNDPANIMVLCDKHHRLIDKIAVDEYPVERLRQMKVLFRDTCRSVLQSLEYQEVPTYTAFWPIGGSPADNPTSEEYAASLRPFMCRPSGISGRLWEQQSGVELNDSWWKNQAPVELKNIKARFSMLSEEERQTAGLYALGPSTMLIGLGAILGNKNSLCVVPKCRKNGWSWQRNEPLDTPFTIDTSAIGEEKFDEVVVTLFLTDTPAESESLLYYFDKLSVPVVNVQVKKQGNDSLAHHKETAAYREALVQLFHNLRNNHSVNRIHLVHCASNVACVEAGRAIEHNHPQFRIYEHYKSGDSKYFIPRLDFITSGDKVKIKSTKESVVNQFHKTFNSNKAT